MHTRATHTAATATGTNKKRMRSKSESIESSVAHEEDKDKNKLKEREILNRPVVLPRNKGALCYSERKRQTVGGKDFFTNK